MALSNYEKQKRWRDKNRALYNFQQRQRRKKNLPVPVLANVEMAAKDLVSRPDTSEEPRKGQPKVGEARESTTLEKSATRKDSRGGQTSTIEQLREMIKVEHEKPAVESAVPVMRVYRSETGMVISREQWEEREEEKRKAGERGFEYDEYSQT